MSCTMRVRSSPGNSPQVLPSYLWRSAPKILASGLPPPAAPRAVDCWPGLPGCGAFGRLGRLLLRLLGAARVALLALLRRLLHHLLGLLRRRGGLPGRRLRLRLAVHLLAELVQIAGQVAGLLLQLLLAGQLLGAL